MSMIGYLLSVTTQDLNEMLKDSSVLEGRIDSADDDGAGGLLDLDKSWEAIFFLLTGHPVSEIEEAKPPLSWTLFSGQLVDEEQDVGYGPAHYVTSEQVRQLNKELDKISIEDLRKKYDGKKMTDAGVYPEIWDEEESCEYVLDNFELLKAFYKSAERENKAVIAFIS